MGLLWHAVSIATLLLVYVRPLQAVAVDFTARLSKEDKKQKASWLAQSDVACSVCERTLEEVYQLAARLQQESIGNRLTEDIVLTAIENVCKFDSLHGQWLRMNSLVQKEGKVVVAPVEGGVLFRSQCDVSCQTMATSCSRLLNDEFDYDALREHLFKGGSEQEALTKMCHGEWTSRCTTTKKQKHKKAKGGGKKQLDEEL